MSRAPTRTKLTMAEPRPCWVVPPSSRNGSARPVATSGVVRAPYARSLGRVHRLLPGFLHGLVEELPKRRAGLAPAARQRGRQTSE